MKVLKARGHLFIPLILLLALMFMGYTPLYAAAVSIFGTVAASWLSKETRMGPRVILKALEEGARGAVGVGAACVIIGIIIGTVSLTGLGLTFGYEVLRYVGEGQLYLGGFFVMIMSTILGMGVPGVAALCHCGCRGRSRIDRRWRFFTCRAYVLPVLCMSVQHYSARSHVFLCSGWHCPFGSDQNVAYRSQTGTDRFHPAILFPE